MPEEREDLVCRLIQDIAGRTGRAAVLQLYLLPPFGSIDDEEGLLLVGELLSFQCLFKGWICSH